MIAAPYRLYRKYRKMKEAGITGVVQCCGYGACPGSVDSAAGELAYEEFADDERSFVERLAAPFWEERAEDFARAVESTLRGAATDDSLQALDRSLDVRAWWRRRDIIALRVLLLQAESSRNIAAFRRYWADASRDGVSGEAALALVGRMRALLVRQRDLGREMARLAYSDSRVGFCPVKDDYLFRARRLRRIVAELAWGELRLEEIAAELRCGGRWPDGPAPDLSGWSVL